MATTGELLLEMSALPSGTAMDHFTHIEFGGQGGVVYLSDTIVMELIEEKVDSDLQETVLECQVDEGQVLCELVPQTEIGEVPGEGAIVCEIIESQISGQ